MPAHTPMVLGVVVEGEGAEGAGGGPLVEGVVMEAADGVPLEHERPEPPQLAQRIVRPAIRRLGWLHKRVRPTVLPPRPALGGLLRHARRGRT